MDWIAAITTNAVTLAALAVVLWLCRKLIVTRLVGSVQHEFDIAIETVRTEQRQSEDRLKADLRLKELEISALRNTALSALSSRQAVLDKRRLEAIDELWQGVVNLGAAKMVAAMMLTLKFEEALAEAKNNARFRETLGALASETKIKEAFSASGVVNARPYVTPMAWAIARAITGILSQGVTRWYMLRGGWGSKDVFDDGAIAKLIKTALPHLSNYVDTHGSAAFYQCIEALEDRLLQEIQEMLTGQASDAASVKQAAEIIRQSEDMLRAQAGARDQKPDPGPGGGSLPTTPA